MPSSLNAAALDLLYESLAKSRSRSSWNDRLTHWEKPASPTEEAQIERAADMVRDALGTSQWLKDEGVTIEPQGSYFNNTNVRQTADQDLRAVHGVMKVEYADGLNEQTVDAQLGLRLAGRSFADVASRMRTEINVALASKFGMPNLDITGNKATRVLALPGSRAPVDVVSTCRYLWVMNNGAGRIAPAYGVAILGRDGTWTRNFPDQHNANGIAKRSRTSHRFKKVVRSLKRIRDELVETKIIGPKQAPSFFIESLTYAVEDEYFLATGPDERYDRMVQIVERMGVLLADQNWVNEATEINSIKYLFRPTQPWSVDDARAFVRAAHARLLEA